MVDLLLQMTQTELCRYNHLAWRKITASKIGPN